MTKTVWRAQRWRGEWPRRGCITLALIAWVLVAGCTALPAYPVNLLPAECPLPVPDELEEGRTITCGMLQVPQDRAAPAALQVKVPYAKIHAESAHPLPDPVVYIVGGPGGSALAEFNEIYARLRPLRRDRDLILYDQRGTLLADPALECNVGESLFASAANDELQDAIEALSARVPSHLHPLDATDVAMARCAEQLQAQGIDLAHYDTATHARDLIDLLAALGYAQYNLYGASYGTRIALEVMRVAPPGLRTAVLDSVYPPTVDAYEMPHTLATYQALQRTFAACAANAACHARYTDLEASFARARRQLDAHPLTLPLSWQPTFDGNDLLRLLLTRFDPTLLPYVPPLVESVARGERALLVAILRGEVPPLAPPRAAPISAADEARVSEFVLALNGAFLAQQAQMDVRTRHEWQQLTARNADRNRLHQFIATNLPAEVAQPLLAQLAQLTDADLALAFAELRSVPIHPLMRGANLAVECHDEQPFNDYATAISAHRQVGIPDALVADEINRLRHFWVQCALFPTGVADARHNQAVRSALPVLILQGEMDTITPPAWAVTAQHTLPNATLLEFPGQGHLVLHQPISIASGCAMKITRAFFDAPRRAPDVTCIAARYQIEWILPEDPP